MDLFDADEFQKAKSLRIRWIILYTVVAAVVVAANLLIVFLLRPINNAGAMASNIILTVLFGCGSLFFFCLPFRLVHKYYKMCKGIRNGIKEHGKGKMLRYEDELTEKDGVEFYGLVLEEEVKKRQDMPEHRILIEHTCPRPDLWPGDKIAYTTQANILIDYEVIEAAPRPDVKTEEETEIVAEEESEIVVSELPAERDRTAEQAAADLKTR